MLDGANFGTGSIMRSATVKVQGGPGQHFARGTHCPTGLSVGSGSLLRKPELGSC